MPPSCLFRAACSQIDKGAVVSLSMSHALSGIDNKEKKPLCRLGRKALLLTNLFQKLHRNPLPLGGGRCHSRLHNAVRPLAHRNQSLNWHQAASKS